MTKENRIRIWTGIKKLFNSQEVGEEKLQKLFSYGDYETYLEKLDDLLYSIKPLIDPKHEYYIKDLNINICIKELLEGMTGVEYFHKYITKNKRNYDWRKLRKRYEAIKPFLESDSEITLKVPSDPNYIYNDLYMTLIEDHGLSEDQATGILNPLLNTPKKKAQTAEAKREFKQFYDSMIGMIESVEREGKGTKEEIEESKQELNHLLKYYK